MRHVVTDDDTASALGSGEVEVLATPRLLAWLEAATVEAAVPHLPPGHTSVGRSVELAHRRPTAVGAAVEVVADEPVVEGHSLVFDVRAVDEEGTAVADGRITRVVVDRARFDA
ncbi:thioesterase family protein [Phycicoccus ginsengisoli]